MISEKDYPKPQENADKPDIEAEISDGKSGEESGKNDFGDKSQEDLVNDFLDLAKEREELISALEVLEKERDEAKEEAARHRAEMYNFRQRMEREVKKQKKLAAESFILEFLPVLDNLDRALNAEDSDSFSHVLEGVEMVHRQFVEVLRKFGVEKIEALGEEFSPRVHEAVFVSEVDDPEKDGVVLREIQKGFIMDDRVIRPARVEVGKYSAEAGDKK